MGALHDGHLSLVETGRQRCDHVIATIFLNPIQFAPGEDLDRYPRTLEQDLDQLRIVGASGVFVPALDEIYPPGFSTQVGVPDAGKPLEGTFRPDHFAGVTTIVLKLFNILPADVGVFGQKDYQQLQVITAIARDLNVDIDIVSAPIVRDPDGLAMSSRNQHLDQDQRRTALRISAALRLATQLARKEPIPGELDAAMMRMLTDVDADSSRPVDGVDYAGIFDAKTLLPASTTGKGTVALIACHVGQTRLIDNHVFG